MRIARDRVAEVLGDVDQRLRRQRGPGDRVRHDVLPPALHGRAPFAAGLGPRLGGVDRLLAPRDQDGVRPDLANHTAHLPAQDEVRFELAIVMAQEGA